jgi:hypothetical protein
LRLLIALAALVVIVLGWQVKACLAKNVVIAASNAHDVADWGVHPAAAVTGPGGSAVRHSRCYEELVGSCGGEEGWTDFFRVICVVREEVGIGILCCFAAVPLAERHR